MANKTVGVNIAFNADTSKAKAQIQELQTLLNKITYSGATGAGQNKISKDLKDASAAAKELQYHLNNAYNTNTGKLDLSLLDKSLKTTGSNITDLSTSLLSAGTTGQQAFVKMAQSISQAEQPMLKINSKVKDFANTLKNAAKYQIGNVVVQGFMSSITSAIGYAKDLNSSLNEIRIVSGKSADEMARFAEQANKAAKRLSATTTDYTNASLIYYQQGLNEADVAARTETTIKMANVAGTSAQTVSDQMTAVWNNFYDGSKSLEYYSDVMVKLGAATASSTDEISEGVNKFAATAKTVGLSYEYATAALATVTATTRESADTVGNAFKTLFSRIQGLTLGETLDDGTTLNKYSKALQSVGISIKDQGGQLKEMDQILDEMGDKWSTLGEAEKTALAQTVGGARQYTQLMALMENWDYFKENLDVAYNSEGTLEEQVKIYEESWAAASKRVEASLQGVYQSLLDDKFFISLNNGFANALGGLEAFIEGAGGAKTVITGLASVMLGAFANKIPDALQTVRYNFDLLTKGSDAAYKKIQEQMQTATNAAYKKYEDTTGESGIDVNSSTGMELQYANDLLAAKNKMAQVTDRMSAAEKQQYETELSLIEAHQKETIALQQKQEELERNIELQRQEFLGTEKYYGANTEEVYAKQNNIFDAKERKYSSQAENFMRANDESRFDTAMAKASDYGIASEVFSEAVDEIEEFTQKINNAYDELNDVLVNGIATGNKITYEQLFDENILEHIDNLKFKLEDIATLDIDDEDKLSMMKNSIIAISDAIPLAIQKATGLSEIFEKIGKEKSIENIEKDIDELAKAMLNATIEGKDFEDVLQAFQDTTNVKKFSRSVKESVENTKKLADQKASLDKLMKAFNPQHVIRTSEALGSLTSVIGTTVTTANSLISIFKTLANPDISGWEKASSVLLGMTSIISMSLNGWKQWSVIIDFFNQRMAKSVILATAEAAVTSMNAKSHQRIAKEIGEENIQKALALALQEKAKGATEEEIAIKLVESGLLDKSTNNIKKNAAARVLTKNAINAETVSTSGLIKFKAQEAIARLTNSVKMAQENGHRVKAIVLETILKTLTGDWVSILKVAGVVIGTLVGGGLIKWLSDIIETQKEIDARLESNLEMSKAAYEAISSEITEITEKFKELGEQRATIDELTEGTVEWQQAVAALNAEVLKLIEQYPILKDYLTQDENGILNISDEGQSLLLGEEQKKLLATNNQKINDTIAKEQNEINKQLNNTWYETTLGAAADLYNNPQIGEQLFTKEYSDQLLASFAKKADSDEGTGDNFTPVYLDITRGIIDEQGEWQQASLYREENGQIIADNQELFKDVYEQFYEEYLLGNEELIKDIAERKKYIEQLQNSKMTSVLKYVGTDRTIDEVDELYDYQDYEKLVADKKQEVKKGFKNWNDLINYKETDDEWEYIQDFLSLQGEDAEYVAQSWGNMVIKVGDEEKEFTKDQVYNALSELYAIEPFEQELSQKIQSELGGIFTTIDFEEANLNADEIFDIDNAVLSIKEKLSNVLSEEDINGVLNTIAADESGSVSLDSLQNFVKDVQQIDLTNSAENLRNFQDAVLQLQNGTMTIEQFNSTIDEMKAKMTLDDLSSHFEEMADKFGMDSDAAESMQDYAEHIMEIAEKSDYFSDALKDNAEAAAETAIEITRMNQGIEKLSKSIKDWTSYLKKSSKESQEYADAMSGIKDAVADVLDVDTSTLSDDFIVNNLEEIEKAATGDEQAIDSLMSKLDEEIILKITTGKSDDFINGVTEAENTLKSELDRINTEIPDIEVGAILDDADFIAAANNLVDTANMSANEANTYFAGIGYEPVYDTTTIEDANQMQSPNVVTTTSLSGSSLSPFNYNLGLLGSGTFYLPNFQVTTKSESLSPTPSENSDLTLTSFSGDGKAPSPIKGLRKKATGSANNSSSKNPGKGSSGGGGGSSSTPKHAQKKNDSDKTRYHTILNQLEDLQAEYDDISEAAERAFGKDKLKNLDAQIKKTDELIDKQEEYLDAIEANLPVDKAVMDAYYQDTIGGPAIEYDERGNIANYDAIQDAMFAKYNQMADAYDEDSTEWQVFEKKYEQLEKYIEQYEETYDLLRDQEQEYQDLLNQRIDLQLEKVQYTIELKLNVSEDQVKLIEYQLGKVEDDGFKSLEAIGLLTAKANELNNQIQINKQGLNEALGLTLSLQEIQQVIAGNMSVLNGKNFTEDQIDAIKEYRDNLLDLNEEFDDIRENIEDKMMETFDAWNEKLETGIDLLDHYSSILESYQNIVDIVGQDTMGLSEEFMANLSQGQVDNAIDKVEATKKAYESLEQARAAAEDKLNEARANGDAASQEMWEKTLEELTEHSQEAQENMLSAWEDALSSIADQFELTVERVVKNFNDAVYSLGGLEGLADDFSKQQERADIMLDDYQKIYELSKLSRDINNSIDDTDLIGGKQKLKKLLGEVNALQEDGVEMSQYDLEYLQKTYDLRLAELELEEAQRAKNTVRLSKDNEGNWSYVYTQNTDAVDAAQQKYEDALYAMQDLSSNYIDEMSEKLIETSQEMAEALAELRVEDFASIDEYYAEVDRVQKYYQEQMDFQEGELNKAIANNKILYDEDWTAYHNATGYKISDTEDFVTAFKDSMLGTLMNSNSDVANFNDLIAGSVDGLTQGLLQAADTYYRNLEDAMNAAGTSTETFGQDIGEQIDQVVAKSDEGATAVEDMADRMNAAINETMDAITTWQQSYGLAMEQIIQSNLDVIESFNEMLATLSGVGEGVTISYDIAKNGSTTAKPERFASGGYTGNWGSSGKLGILDEKELILNQNDTANMLSMLQLTHELLNMIDLQTQTAKLGFGDLVASTIKDSQKEVLEQKVEITAEFPNVTDHNEIEEALMNLTNTASQYANRK